MNLKNKIAIVTGATKGIGRAIAEVLIRQGASVCVTARTQTEIDETVRELTRGLLKTGQRVQSKKHEGVNTRVHPNKRSRALGWGFQGNLHLPRKTDNPG